MGHSAEDSEPPSNHPDVQEPSSRQNWVEPTLLFGVLLLFSWLGIALAQHSEGVATIWLTNGMLFAFVITRPRRLWPWYFLLGLVADTLADVLHGDRFALAAGVSVANSVEVISSSYLLTWWFGSPFNLSRRRPLVGFLVVAVGCATALTSALGATWTLLFVDAGPWWQMFRTWYLGDVLGMAIMAPLVFVLLRPGFFSILRADRIIRTLLVLLVPAVATVLVFMHDRDPLIFLIFPAVLLVVFRLGFPGTVLMVFVIAILSIALTITGHGPLMLIPHVGMLHRIVVVQIFLAVSLLTAFPVAALLEERKALEVSLQRSEARYKALSAADGLTGLANRRRFDERLQDEWHRGVEERHSLALLLIDVDCFKSYNDRYGHLNGDACLRQIARTIASALPPEAGAASRFGGEEFAVILPRAGQESAAALGERLRLAIEGLAEPHTDNPAGIQTISVGVAAQVPSRPGDALHLLAEADRALYLAKHLGRNRVQVSEPVAAVRG